MQLAALEPGCDAGFLVGVAAEHAVAASGRRDVVGQVVFARAEQLEVIAVVRPVVGDHGVEISLEHLVAAFLAQYESDVQVGHETAFLEPVGVVFQGADVGFQVHIGVGGGAHHARRIHLDRLQVHGADIQTAALLGFADRVFLGLGKSAAEQGGEREGELYAHRHIPRKVEVMGAVYEVDSQLIMIRVKFCSYISRRRLSAQAGSTGASINVQERGGAHEGHSCMHS